MASDQKERLLQALDQVHKAMNSPNAFENSKESTFSSLRRGCLDLRKDLELLDSEDFTAAYIQDAWLFLIELSKAKLRRKHALECINIMLASPKWGSVLRNSEVIQSKLPTISKDMQVALGYITSADKPDSPTLKPSQSKLTRGTSSTPIPVSANIPRLKSKVKRGNSKIIQSINSSRRGSDAADQVASMASDLMSTPPDNSIKVSEDVPKSIVEPGRRPEVHPPDEENKLNPFRMDFNPFKDFRGQSVDRRVTLKTENGKAWWDDDAVGGKSEEQQSLLPEPWWNHSIHL